MKIKKVKVTYSVAIMMLMSLLISGCSASGEGKDNKEQSTGDNLSLTIVGGSAGGAWNIIGEGIGNSIKKQHPGTTFTYQPGQDGANVLTVTQGKAPFGLISSEAANLAYKGEFPFNSKVENVRAVAYINSMPYHFVVTENSKIDSIDQIVEKKLPFRAAVSTERSIFEITSQVVLDSYNTSYKEIEKNGGKIHFIAPVQGVNLIKERKMDGFMVPLPTPASYIEELNTSVPVKLLPLSDASINKMKKELGAEEAVIKAGTYSFVKEDIPTAAARTILIASADVPDEVVYKVTKAIYEDIESLHNVHQSFKNMTKETITNIQDTPFHDGAIKFYKEVGIMD